MFTIRLRQVRITRIICLVFALHILNLSIDPNDPEPDFAGEDITINEIESFTEFFAEIVLGFENAFAEHDEHDSSNGATLDFFKVFFVTQHIAGSTDTSFTTVRTKFFIYAERCHSQLIRDINPPPPKA